ncbi:MAG: hypothetical protein EZS28_027750 [Streblomastix strix]|uniref:Uncharacterized protein n=1 Tax=Streblomastix strix TaxID=222440 RepID=A0A5J4V2Q1_9EUKA|nr:MAG: hypothetical protein EZS28_027750 [Streblomastix strix]
MPIPTNRTFDLCPILLTIYRKINSQDQTVSSFKRSSEQFWKMCSESLSSTRFSYNISEITFYINSGFAQILSLLICKCGGERDSTHDRIKETIKAILECHNRFLYIDDLQKAIKAMDEQLELEGVIEEVESIVLLKDQELKKEALSFKEKIQKIYKKRTRYN